MNRQRSKLSFAATLFGGKTHNLDPEFCKIRDIHTPIDTHPMSRKYLYFPYICTIDRGVAVVPLAWEVVSPYACFFAGKNILHKLSTSCDSCGRYMQAQQISIIVRPPRAAPGPLLRDFLPLEDFSVFSSLICSSWASTAT